MKRSMQIPLNRRGPRPTGRGCEIPYPRRTMGCSCGILNRSKALDPLDEHFVRKFVEWWQLPCGCSPAGQFIKPCGTIRILSLHTKILQLETKAAVFIAPPPIFVQLCPEAARLHSLLRGNGHKPSLDFPLRFDFFGVKFFGHIATGLMQSAVTRFFASG
jgi:hypothetical protein